MKNLLQTLFFFLLVTQISFAQWYQQNSGITSNLRSIHFEDANNGWTVGDGGIILHTVNAGQEWITQTSGTINHLYDICFFDLNTGWIVGDNGTILKTTNGGTNWSQQTSGTTFTLRSLHLIDANKCWAVGDSGRILITTNGGTSWISQNYPTNLNLEDVCFSDDDNGIIVGRLGTMSGPFQIILRTTDGGVTWVELYSGVDGELNGIAHIEANIYIAVGGAYGGSGGPLGRILRTTDGGTTWTLVADIIDVIFNKVHFANPNDGWVVGTDTEWSLIFSTSDGGTTWIEQTINPTIGSLRDVFFIDALNGWAVGDNGTIINTTNGGVSFVDEEQIDEIPTEFFLSQNYPNPFNPTTSIQYAVSSRQFVFLKVYDVLGNEIETLVNEEKPSGTYEITWYAANLPSGVYFYQLKAGNFIETKKMLLLK